MSERIGPYRIIRLINRGGQGSVYLGYDARLNRRVAIKLYSLPTERDDRRRLLREARIIARMDSPKVVVIHDVIESDTHLALVMEYVPGCSLEEFLQQVHPSMSALLTVVREVAGALALARQNQIVHGDLKPSNILIAADGTVKLTDFGIARTKLGPRQASLAPAQSAVTPEHYRGEALDHRSDLFALGCLVYRMLTGRHPFFRDGSLDPELLLKGDPVPLRQAAPPYMEVPEPLVKLVNALLRKDPLKRPRTTRGTRLAVRLCTRDMTIASGDSLLEEARPCFRHEDPDDLPLQLPRGFKSFSRSLLPPRSGVLPLIAHYWQLLRLPVRVALVVGVIGVSSGTAWYIASRQVTPIQFTAPAVSVAPQGFLPGHLALDWMLNEAKRELRRELGLVEVIGEIGMDPVRVVYTEAARPDYPLEPDVVFSLSVHCDVRLCLLDITREEDGALHSGQQVLFNTMSRERWQSAMRQAVRQLYL